MRHREMKILLHCLWMVALRASHLHAQAPEWNWAMALTGPNNESISQIATDPAGDIYITGSYSSPSLIVGSTTLTNTDPTDDMFVAKFHPDGSLVWAVDTDGPGYEAGRAIAVDPTGHAYILMAFMGSLTYGGQTFGSADIADVLLAKLDQDGNPIWVRKISSPGADRPEDLALDPFGNVIISGSFEGAQMVIGPSTFINQGGEDAFVAKFSATGDHIWSRCFGGTTDESCYGVSVDPSGNVIAVGSFDSSSFSIGSIPLGSLGNDDSFIAQFTSAGSPAWAVSAGGDEYDLARGVECTPTGDLIVLGYSSSGTFAVGGLEAQGGGGGDVFIMMLHSDGEAGWVTLLGGDQYEYPSHQVGLDSNGNIYIAGCFQSASLGAGASTLTNLGDNDAFVAKLAPDGVIQWAASGGGAGFEVPSGMAVDDLGNVCIAGRHTLDQDMAFGSTLLVSDGEDNAFFARLGNLDVGTEDLLLANHGSLQWNADLGQLVIDPWRTGTLFFSVHDLQGRQVVSTMVSDLTTVDLSGYSSGLYVVVLTTAGRREVRRIYK